MLPIARTRWQWTFLVGLGLSGACATDHADEPSGPIAASSQSLENRAYIVSRESEELTVIDLDRLEVIKRIPTGGKENHMAELTGDFSQLLVTSSATDEGIVVDARRLEVTGSVPITGHPSHLARTPDDRMFAVMMEDTNEVAFLDANKMEVSTRIAGFSTPHFMRFSPDGNWGYVANIGGNRISRVDMQSMKLVGEISLDGYADRREVEEEGGFADAQVASDGTLYAAHHSSGRVITVDSMTGEKKSEFAVGQRPWVVFAEHPYQGMKLRHVVPNFGDQTISVIDGQASKPNVAATLTGDEEAYGVNFSPIAPDLAFVMNRVRQDIAIVDTNKNEIVERIDVGGNTETASTTADGKLIVATVSSANRVVIIDVATRTIKKTLDNIGKYPWSVTIPRGQNYCH